MDKEKCKKLTEKAKKLYKEYKTNAFKYKDEVMVGIIRGECFTAITVSKENYLKSVGSKLVDKNTGQ